LRQRDGKPVCSKYYAMAFITYFPTGILLNI
ncbi:unnamed protein product, partial [marine sediment metagenome]